MTRNSGRWVSYLMGIVAYLSLNAACVKHVEHTPDERLQGMFRTHEVEFNRLVEMAREDVRIHSIAPALITIYDPTQSWIETDADFMPSKRWAEYNKLFQSLPIPSGILKDGSVLAITVDRPSVANGDSAKGFVYSPEALKTCSTDLEVCLPAYGTLARQGRITMYKHIVGNWFLFLHYN